MSKSENKEKKMITLSRDAILTKEDITIQEVEVKEWGGKVLIRTLSGDVRDSIEKLSVEAKENNQSIARYLKARLVVLACVGEDGNLLFKEADIERLNEKASKPIDSIADAVLKMNGMGATSIKDVEKN